MQQFVSFLLAGISFFLGLFSVRVPEKIVWDKADAIAIYQEIAAKNAGLALQERTTVDKVDFGIPTSLGDYSSQLFSALQSGAWVGRKGLPGQPAKITADDLASAKVLWYDGGDTVEITLTPKNQTTDITGKAADGSVGKSIGVKEVSVFTGALKTIGFSLNGLFTVTYQNPKIVIVAGADGKIRQATYSYDTAASGGTFKLALLTVSLITITGHYEAKLA
ncbi:MAG: hypothetical protein LBB50_04365 [Oscillospiraceae bacterium]|nr:hypothetical protein [Oscillospiraceae bacterium]